MCSGSSILAKRTSQFFHFIFFNPVFVYTWLCELVLLFFFPFFEKPFFPLGKQGFLHEVFLRHSVLCISSCTDILLISDSWMMQDELQKAVHTTLGRSAGKLYDQTLEYPQLWCAGALHLAWRNCFLSTQPHPMYCGCSHYTIPKYQMLLCWCWVFFSGGLVNTYGWIVLSHHNNNSRTVGNNWKLLYKHGTFKYLPLNHVPCCQGYQQYICDDLSCCDRQRYEVSASLCSHNKCKLVFF